MAPELEKIERGNDLRENMKLLIALQDFDSRIGHILVQKEEGPKKIQRLEQRLKEVEARLTEEAGQVEALIRERRDTEKKIEDSEIKLNKSNLKLSTIKSNKEYHAALKEIDDLKKAKYLLEEKAIGIMEQLEALDASCAASREQAAEMKRQFDAEKEAVMRSLDRLEHELHTLEEKKLGVARDLDKELLTHYDALRKRKGGIAVSPVVQGVCQTCYLRIPPQEFNELIRGDKLMTCPNCTRIIYWGDDQEYQRQQGDGEPA